MNTRNVDCDVICFNCGKRYGDHYGHLCEYPGEERGPTNLVFVPAAKAHPEAAQAEPDDLTWIETSRFDLNERLAYLAGYKDGRQSTPPAERAQQGEPVGMGALIAVTKEKNKLHTALAIACEYLTDEQAAAVAAAMPAAHPQGANEPAEDAARLALENVRLLAARHRKEEWAQHMLRFCESAGVTGSPLRAEAERKSAAAGDGGVSQEVVRAVEGGV